MAKKENYRLLLSLGFLGFNYFLSLFLVAIGKENTFESFSKSGPYNFSVGNVVYSSQKSSFEEIKVKSKGVLLALNIFADKQYYYDQNIYLAEGNVKVKINGGILRSDLLRYEKSTGILSAEGNVSFVKGGQYFRGKEFRFNLLKKEGIIKDTYGILDMENILDDLNFDFNPEKLVEKNRSTNNKGSNTYIDGIEFDFGNINVPQNRITRSNKSIGKINNWRLKSDLITIQENGWKSNRVQFTNDPFNPHQISFEGIDVLAEYGDDGELIITSFKTNLILGSKTKIFLGKRIFGGKRKKKNKFELMMDGKDRDGLVLIRRNDSMNINSNIKLDFIPQFLIGRAILGKTNSYDDNQNEKDKTISFSDLFGVKLKSKANFNDWSFDSVSDLSTLNTKRIFSGLRNYSSLKKDTKIPILDDSSFNIFTTYRSRAWNGTMGQTEIKSAYGGFIEKTHSFQSGNIKNDLNLRFGTAKYKAEKLRINDIISLWRSSIFASLDSEYKIWKKNQKNLDQKKEMILSPIVIYPELFFKTEIDSGYFKYEDSSEQGFVKIAFGPQIRLGELERNFLDYTKLSVMPGIKFKSGNSPFKFDNAIDFKTINISLIQQIYGPLMVDILSNLNIDNNSENYGEYYDTKLGILWHKRAYECGIYYHPENHAGGVYFRINGFDFDDSVEAIF